MKVLSCPKLFLLLLGVVAVLGISMPAKAILIDGFDGPGVDLLITSFVADPETLAEPNGTDDGSILGGERDTLLSATRNSALGTTSQLRINPLDSSDLILDNATDVIGVVTLQYDGQDDGDIGFVTDGLGADGMGEDLTAGGSFGLALDVVSIDHDTFIEWLVYTDGGANSDTVTSTLFLGTTGFHITPFSAFTGLDFSDVSAIQLTINSNPTADLDLRLESISTVTPEPMTASLSFLSLSTIGLSLLGRRRSLA